MVSARVKPFIHTPPPQGGAGRFAQATREEAASRELGPQPEQREALRHGHGHGRGHILPRRRADDGHRQRPKLSPQAHSLIYENVFDLFL